MLKSERVYLRAVEPKDLDYLYLEENDSSSWHLSSTLIPFSKRTLEDYVNSIHDLQVQKQFRFIIELRECSGVIGMLDLFDYDAINERAGIGVIITNLEQRKKGLASESLILILEYAKEVLFLNQLYCTIQSNNVESIKLFENLGFERIGIRKNWYKVGANQWEDEIEYQYLLSNK